MAAHSFWEASDPRHDSTAKLDSFHITRQHLGSSHGTKQDVSKDYKLRPPNALAAMLLPVRSAAKLDVNATRLSIKR